MTREEEIYNAMGDAEWKHIDGTKDIELFDMGFKEGAKWADQHPHWISVEDEEPPKGQWIITYEPTSPIVVGTDIILPDETADEHHITHWMPLPEAPKGGEE